jgi:hypothetical protein
MFCSVLQLALWSPTTAAASRGSGRKPGGLLLFSFSYFCSFFLLFLFVRQSTLTGAYAV